MLEALLEPKTIAIVGTSRKPGKVGHEVLRNLLNNGYGGTLIPVNPKGGEILGLACRTDLKGLGTTVDLGIIVVPARAVLGAVEQCIEAGAKAISVITSGFKEVGGEGAKLERQIADLCKRRRVRLMGPNCIGVINTAQHLNATFAPFMPPRGHISVISQSGALCVAILDKAKTTEMGLSKVISFGNKADLDEVDFLQALAEDPDTKVIAGYLESIDDGKEFMRVASETAAQKPIVLLKVGVTDAGARAASSHTGSLAGADIAYGAAFKRSGVIRAEDFEALFDYASAFALQPLPIGNRVAVITNAGGPGIMAADAVETQGLIMPTPSAASQAAMAAALPDAASVINPVDVLGDAPPERYIDVFKILQDDPDVDAIVIIATPQNMTEPTRLAIELARIHRGKKPVLAAFMGGHEVAEAHGHLMKGGIPNYPSPGRAVRAARALVEYARWRQRPPRIVSRFPVNRHRVDRIMRRHSRTGRKQINEVEAKEILRAYDLYVPEGHHARGADEAVEISDRVGYPIAMKIVSPDVIHKSDVGGVKLNLATRDQVRDAYDLMTLRIKRLDPDIRIEGVYVEQMGTRGREVILGMTRDPQFGPMLMFGLGGIFVEVMKDVSFHLAPVTAEEALQMLKSTRSYALLEGTRGQAPVDLEAIASAIQRISQLVTDYPQISELDINPFIVGEVGTRAYAADARITLSETGRPE